MKNFPNKFIPASHSILSNMLKVMQTLPDNGTTIDILRIKLTRQMDIADIVDALTCLYAIGSIEIDNRQIKKI